MSGATEWRRFGVGAHGVEAERLIVSISWRCLPVKRTSTRYGPQPDGTSAGGIPRASQCSAHAAQRVPAFRARGAEISRKIPSNLC